MCDNPASHPRTMERTSLRFLYMSPFSLSFTFVGGFSKLLEASMRHGYNHNLRFISEVQVMLMNAKLVSFILKGFRLRSFAFWSKSEAGDSP